MLRIKDLLDAIVGKARAIPELVTAVNQQPLNIYSLDNISVPVSNMSQAVASMIPPSIMLAYLGTELGTRGDMPAWAHHFCAYVKADAVSRPNGANAHDLFRLFILGTPEGDDESMLYLDPLPNNCDPLDGLGFDRAVADNGDEHWVIRFTYTEKGP